MHTRSIFLISLSCLVTMTALISCVAVPSGTPTFRIATDGEGNQMTVQVTGNTAVFEVRSETGIGSATAELISGALPEKIVIRLHLRGLEKLDFNYAQTVVTASISSHGDYAVRESVRTEGTGAERPIGQESPYWMNVRVVVPAGQSGSALSWPPVLAMPHEPGDQARETAPPVGHFEVEVPDDFLKGGYRAFSLDWIDFYR